MRIVTTILILLQKADIDISDYFYIKTVGLLTKSSQREGSKSVLDVDFSHFPSAIFSV